MSYTKDLAARIRRSCGNPRIEGSLDTWLPARPDLAVIQDPGVVSPCYVALGAGCGLILLPPNAALRTLLHELAHHERGDGLAAYLQATAGDHRARQRLARVAAWSEEAGARRLVDLLLSEDH
ncbi:MAG: hypothetical protein FJX77_00060 [Armatimonadetes bacterium]|nr:hypothetical protein [Armatimonadota bacterium]